MSFGGTILDRIDLRVRLVGAGNTVNSMLSTVHLVLPALTKLAVLDTRLNRDTLSIVSEFVGETGKSPSLRVRVLGI